MIQDEIMKLQTYKMFEGEDTVYVERDDVLEVLKQEPCEDAISREDAMSTILCYGNEIKTEVMDDIKASMIKLQPATPKPKTGHWIKHEHNGIGNLECSECLCWFLEAHLFCNGYCPNCGAKMESEKVL